MARRRTRVGPVRRAVVALAGAACLFGSAAALSAQRALDLDVKAAYLINFARFIRRPAGAPSVSDSNQPAVCVLGRDPFGPALDETVKLEQIEGQQLVARRITRPEDASGCLVLFVSATEAGGLANLLERLRGAPVLTVSDTPRFLENGGMIAFVPVGNRIRFEINLTAAEKAGLTLSSDLLRVALAVKRVEA